MKAELHIETVVRSGVTLLKNAYCTPPFKVMDITEDKREGILQLMLMSSSPGILDGDNYQVKIELGMASRFELLTQSYQRLFRMKQGARQNFQVHLEKDAQFSFLPHPVVPHENADFISGNKIFLSEGCMLIWGEVVTCGRKLSGELFRFTRYHSITEIFLCGKLVIKENMLMQPGLFDVNGLGQLEGFTHQATIIFLHEKALVKKLIPLMTDWLQTRQEIVFGVTMAPINGIIIRILGNKAEQLHYCIKKIENYLKLQTNSTESRN